MKLMTTALSALFLAGAAQAGNQVTYSANGKTYEGYFAPSQDAFGTVVILPTWNGISDYEKDRADMLSDMGYDAFVGDLHGKGNLPASMEEKAAAHDALFSETDQLLGMLRATVETAEDLSGPNVVVLGYSMGGGATMELARSGLGNELGVDGYAVFSGRVSDPLGRLIPDATAPIFVAHGEKDSRLPVSQLMNFENDLDFTGVDYRIEVYPGVGHLFSAFGFPNYNAEADRKSWSAFSEFLEKTLKNGSGS